KRWDRAGGHAPAPLRRHRRWAGPDASSRPVGGRRSPAEWSRRMTTRAIPPLLALALVAGVVSAAGARPAGGPEARGRATIRRALIVDNSQRIDVNQISMVVTNTGSIAY